MKSILQKEKECFFCGSTVWLEEHHIFGGALRKKSERFGLKVWLCHNDHNEPPNGVHHNMAVNLKLKQIGQKAFEEKHGHETFMKEFYKNYV